MPTPAPAANEGRPDLLDAADARIARGELAAAEDLLRDALRASPGSLKVREELASLLVRREQLAEAATLLDEVADACARAGMPGRAIAALKKLARFRPEALPDAGRRIAALARRRDEEAAHDASARPAGAGTRTSSVPDAAPPARRSPLFSDFSADELAAVIRGLDLRSVAPGDLVVTQGEPGHSLFVVAAGSVKVWVREGDGGSRFVRSLGEGEFFGEVSLLTGRPRTATVCAAVRTDLLELEWSRVEEIVREHPRVAEVLRTFCDERLQSDLSGRGAP